MYPFFLRCTLAAFWLVLSLFKVQAQPPATEENKFNYNETELLINDFGEEPMDLVSKEPTLVPGEMPAASAT